MADGLIGAIIGGLMALGGAWLSFWLQRKHDANVLRETILAELIVGRDVLTRRGRADVFLELFDKWDATGKPPYVGWLAEAFAIDASTAFPVYYALAGHLGALGEADASAVVSFYSEAIGLLRSSRIILSAISPDDGDSSAASQQLREDYLHMVGERQKLIDQLTRSVANPKDCPAPSFAA